jgi:hypothetical protein
MIKVNNSFLVCKVTIIYGIVQVYGNFFPFNHAKSYRDCNEVGKHSTFSCLNIHVCTKKITRSPKRAAGQAEVNLLGNLRTDRADTQPYLTIPATHAEAA